jgi:glutamyl-tRNA synthetase
MVRVRFAPSPTGDLHVGGLRTALYNYLFARKSGGTFILRIEDTDRERHVSDAQARLLATLQLCGFTPDEGPTVGGEHAPYVQSERQEFYREAAERLMNTARAYPCFCSPERLNELRQQQKVRGETPRYDGKCRYLDLADARERMKDEAHVIRLAVPTEGEIVHQDVVWGEVRFPLADVDDQVLIKSDGFPTYHLANVVDDGAMGVTHVIRGEEWLISVPKHLLLYDYLELSRPKFAHLPLILNTERQKLSKREGAGSVQSWLDRGIPPEALINYIALLGWNPGDDREIFHLHELIDVFSLERVNKSGAVFDPVKLEWISGEHIRRMDPAVLLKQSRPFLVDTEFDGLPDDALSPLLAGLQKNLTRLAELPEKMTAFSQNAAAPDDSTIEWLNSEAARTALPHLLKEWRNIDSPDTEKLLDAVKRSGKELNIKGKELWMPLRAALTGRTAGPELRLIIAHVGANEMIGRLERSIQAFGTI